MTLTFGEYNKVSVKTAVYPGQGTFLGLLYVTGKACGEAGEFSENVCKALRDDDIVREFVPFEDGSECVGITLGPIEQERRQKLIMELGDELWYWFAKCRELGVNPEEVAYANMAKLTRRAAEGKIQGSGSDR